MGDDTDYIIRTLDRLRKELRADFVDRAAAILKEEDVGLGIRRCCKGRRAETVCVVFAATMRFSITPVCAEQSLPSMASLRTTFHRGKLQSHPLWPISSPS